VHAPSTPRASRAGQHEAPIATVHDSSRRGLYTAQDTWGTRGTQAGPFLRDRSGIVTGDDGWVRPLRGLRDSATERAAEECDSVRGYSAGVCALDVVSECGHFVSFLMPSDSAVRNNVSTVTTTCRMRKTRTDVRAHIHARACTRTQTHAHLHARACAHAHRVYTARDNTQYRKTRAHTPQPRPACMAPSHKHQPRRPPQRTRCHARSQAPMAPPPTLARATLGPLGD
jgi:hypothetical protein